MKYEIRIGKNVQSQPLAIVRHRVTASQLAKFIPQSCGLVWNFIRSQNIKGADRHVAVYLDDQINLEVGVELQSPLAAAGDEVVGSALPAGPFAMTTHLGPYTGLHLAHRAIRDFCIANRVSMAGPNWEIYDHWNNAWNDDPSGIRTEIFYLLAAQPSLEYDVAQTRGPLFA